MKRAGFSLIETVVAIFLLSLLTVVLLNLYPSSVLAVRRAEQIQTADSLAQSVLSQAASRPFSSLLVGANEALPETEVGGQTYQATLSIRAVAGADVETLKALQVTVRWSERNKSREVSHEIWVPRIQR